jgi:hypothetical protein
MVVSAGETEKRDGLVLVQASKHGAWQGAVLPAVVALFSLLSA